MAISRDGKMESLCPEIECLWISVAGARGAIGNGCCLHALRV